MSANAKKWINRGGLIGMIVGVVLIVIGGGDVAAATETVGLVAGIAGTIMVLVREIMS
jgi:hypothetical protein